MAVITVLGSGIMATALATPLTDNGHEVRLVGTHLDREIIASIQETGIHPNLGLKVPEGVTAHQLEDAPRAFEGVELVMSGVNSFGVDWAGDQFASLLRPGMHVIALAKGMQADDDGNLTILPRALASRLPEELRSKVCISAIAGSSIAGEVAVHRHTNVVVQDGLFERFPCDAIFGLHNWPGMPVGHVGIRPGPILASSNTFEIIITGKGSHAAMPHNGIDPVAIAATLVQAFQTIISRNRNPIEAAILSVTQIHTGDAVNIVPDHATLRGTVRTFSVEMIDLIETRMKALAESICSGFGAKVEFRFQRNYPPTINDPEQTAFVTQVLTDVIGPDNIVSPIDPVMAAEDFSFMLLQRPGCYFFLGNGDGTHRADGHGDGPCLLHNPSYDFNDDAIPFGATLWVRLVEAFLRQ